MRWFIFFVFLIVAAGAAAFCSYEGSPLRVWLEKRAEEERNAPTPENTLLAPFATDVPENYTPPTTKEDIASRLPINKVPLDQQHRNEREISDWIVKIVAESLAFDGENFDNVTTNIGKYFIQSAYDEYTEFLQKGNFKNSLVSNNLRLYSFVESTPVLVTKESLEGRYRWLFKVPIMLSFLDKSARDYKGKQATNNEIIITLQVGRYDEADTSGILIESYKVRIKK